MYTQHGDQSESVMLINAVRRQLLTLCNRSQPLPQAPFRNRKQVITQNVLGVCTFAMMFIYVLAGYEGSAHDSPVLEKAMRIGFAIPAGCFVLGDAAYGIAPWLLTPFRGVRYHLKEWTQAFRNGKYVTCSTPAYSLPF
jgi:hypothetical protein